MTISDPENSEKKREIDNNPAPFNMAQSFKKLPQNVNKNDESSNVMPRRPSSSGKHLFESFQNIIVYKIYIINYRK